MRFQSQLSIPVFQRHRRYTMLTRMCLFLTFVCLFLTACKTTPSHRDFFSFSSTSPALPSSTLSIPSLPSNLPFQYFPPPSGFILPDESSLSPWDRVRQRFRLPASCNDQPEVIRWARIYTANPENFSASLVAAMPFLLLVMNQLEYYDLPGEFAFLPYVESTYTPFVGHGNNPAGIWQIVPDTGREFGLKINPYYDGRLDIYTSTLAAATLLKQYEKEFGDWRLVNMAFNAGKYQVKKLVASNSRTLSPSELSRLKLSPITHEHLTKLLALTCIISDPARFGVTLPEPRPDDPLQLVKLDSPLSLRLAAHVTDLSEARLRQLNPGYLQGYMPVEGPYHLLLPATRAENLQRIITTLPSSHWNDWRWLTLQNPQTLHWLAQTNNIDVVVLADINSLEPDALLEKGKKLLIPGRDPADRQKSLQLVNATSDIHIVRADDTLWGIARKYRLRLDDLTRWNGLSSNSMLRLGQKLKLREQ